MSDGKPEQSWWESRPPWVRISIIVGAVLVFILIWWLVPPLLYAATSDEAVRVKAITDTRTALLAGLVGIGALGTFWMNSRNVKLTAKTLGVSEANLRLAERSQKESFELTERGHLTDRYSKAIEQLGNDNLDIRLGGIYALEQLASDSEQARDQATIIEVLSAFVRVHSDPLYQYKASLPETAQPEPADEERQKAIEYVNELDRPPVDVQAAVTVLGRLPTRSELTVGRADLTEAWLTRANLLRANLTGARLDQANLTEADLLGADLTEAFLTGADLIGAYLSQANLTKARLVGANLTEATLGGANLTGAWLPMANLTGARLDQADLSGAVYLVQEQVDVAFGDEDTLLPAGLCRPESWNRGEASEPR